MIDFAGSIFMREICDNLELKSIRTRDLLDSNNRVSRENMTMSNTRQEIRDWLQAELNRKGYGAKGKLAKHLGLNNDGITRMLNTEPGKEARQVKADELLKMGEFFNSTPPGLGAEQLIRSELPLGAIPVIGKIAANNWMDVDNMDFSYDDMHHVPAVGEFPISSQFALIIDGNCLNKIAQHGETLVCLDVIKEQVEPQPGDLVIVERKKFGGQMVERTAKRLKQSAKGYELWPESNDPSHQEPIVLYEPAQDIEVTIIGKVLWIMKKP